MAQLSKVKFTPGDEAKESMKQRGLTFERRGDSWRIITAYPSRKHHKIYAKP